MNTLFQNLITASFHGSIVICAVVLLRPLLKKTPRKFICLLWMLAFLRLLMPFEIRSELSLQPQPEKLAQTQVLSLQRPQSAEEELLLPQTPFQPPLVVVEETEAVQEYAYAQETTVEAAERKIPVSAMLYVWAAVAACFALYCGASYIRLKITVREAVMIPGGWECDRIDTAFILGFIRPRIYIPMGLPEAVRRHILAHERTHLEKGDHWYKMIAYIALALHWFNPLVWLAYILLCKDIELACDERVVQFMELPERKAYSAALLRCSSSKAHFAACPVAFGEVSVKERIKTVLSYRKPSFWISLVGVIAIGFVAVCLMTSPAEETDTGVSLTETTLSDDRHMVTVSNVEELLSAIGPDTVIELEPGEYNLCEAENYGKETMTQYYSWEPCYDGYELTLHGIENLTLSGSGKFVTSLVTEPRYANVIKLQNCEGVLMEDLTAGHTKGSGECSGGVVALEGCAQVDMRGLGLYGCGVIGLIADLSRNITLTDSDIYECSNSAVSLFSVSGINISGCRIYDIGTEQYGGYTFLSVGSSDGVVVSDCEFSGSTLSYLMYASQSRVELRDNLFQDNRTREAAFTLHGENVVLVDNRFADNNIRTWYDAYGSFAYDQNGQPLTEFTQTKTAAEEATQPMLQIRVSTVDEFIAAIGPNREIILEGELYDFSTATGYGSTKGDHYYWENIYDGPGLVICNVENMTIRSNDGNVTGHTLSAVPRYADVLTFSSCRNITLSGFTAGHTIQPGNCAGGVFEFRDCDGMTVDSCGLYGCGILGVYAEYSSGITVKNSDIYECSQGGVKFRGCDGIVLENNTFRDLGGSETTFIDCSSITVDKQLLDPHNQSLSESVTANVVLGGEENEDRKLLQNTVLDFASAYFAGSGDYLKANLASTYSRQVDVYGDSEPVTVTYVNVPYDYPTDMEAMGFCVTSVTYTKGEDGQQYMLTLEMTRESGAWKVQDYYEGVKDSLYLGEVISEFAMCYFHKEPEGMKAWLSSRYTGPVSAYPGDMTAVEQMPYTPAAEFSDQQLEQMQGYRASLPFKETRDSDSYTYLNIALEREDGTWKVTEYGLEK